MNLIQLKITGFTNVRRRYTYLTKEAGNCLRSREQHLKYPCDSFARSETGAMPSAPAGATCMVFAATILGSSLAFIDGTVVNVALPSIQHALMATVSGAQWVVESYALFLAALILLGGAAGTSTDAGSYLPLACSSLPPHPLGAASPLIFGI